MYCLIKERQKQAARNSSFYKAYIGYWNKREGKEQQPEGVSPTVPSSPSTRLEFLFALIKWKTVFAFALCIGSLPCGTL